MHHASSSRASFMTRKSKIYSDPDFHQGSSEFNYPNGDKYIGDYCAHKTGLVWKEGLGTYHTNDGQSYNGIWYDDKLIEGEIVEITFKDGTVYEGPLEKYKFKGAGCLTLPGNLKIIMEFIENKPAGDIILVDNKGKCWSGNQEEDSATFFLENIHFENIPPHRGKAESRTKQAVKHHKILEQLEREAVDMAEMEKRIFKKSEKLPEDYDFENSDWYRNYVDFKRKQQIIMGKVKGGLRSELTDDEFQWCMKYEEFKDKYNKVVAKRKMKPNDPVDLSLMYTFYSEEYKSSKPNFIIYPKKNQTS